MDNFSYFFGICNNEQIYTHIIGILYKYFIYTKACPTNISGKAG